MSSDTGSVSQWLAQLKAGDPSAAQDLWNRYFQQIVALARKKLLATRRQVMDEEDVALSAFASFCRGASLGRFPQLTDRTDLWRLLVVLTARKVFHHCRDEERNKRGIKCGVSRSLNSADPRRVLEKIVSREPGPEFAAQVADECQRLLNLLGSFELRSIALWRMEGYTVDEIAGRLSCARTTVERRLRLIRSFWKEEGRS
ncbi:MAG TPA: ECF-type sigma factor [Gemmataceae bacterium]|nr:ECF-type sigma factor [Gemmataceae bacterium]